MLIGKEALYAKRTLNDFKKLSYVIQTGNGSFNEKALRKEIDHYEKFVNNPVLGKIIDWSNFPLQSNDLKFMLTQGKHLIGVADDLAGASGPRKYLVAFQNSAEARGTGGIIGGYALVEIKNGKFKVLRVGPNTDLVSMRKLPIKVSSEYYKIYGDDPAIWQNSNYSPDFPSGAKIWLALWKNQFGEELDGVIAIDPFVLEAILSTTAPLKMPDGVVLDSKNIVRFLLSDLYVKYETDNLARKNYLVDIVRRTLDSITGPNVNQKELLKGLLKPAMDGRILIYSKHIKEEAEIKKSDLGGSLTLNPNDISLVVMNTSGNKMDYYLKRTVSIERRKCGKDSFARINVKLENQVPSNKDLPNYVKGRLDLNRPAGLNNSHGVTVFIYGPKNGSYLLSGSRTYSEMKIGIGEELGRPLFVTNLELKSKKPVDLFVDFTANAEPLSTKVQSLVIDQSTTILDDCKSGR